MTLLTVFLALFIEQFRPLSPSVWREGFLGRLPCWLEEHCNGGQARHGLIAWMAGVGLPALLVQIIYIVLLWVTPVFALLLSLGVLYLTMGFRQFSHSFSEIEVALRGEQLGQAREILARWRGQTLPDATTSDVAKLAIENAIIATHRHVFAPLFWFAVVGPGGTIAYRLSLQLYQMLCECNMEENRLQIFSTYPRRVFLLLDWLPSRATALGFAIMGDFEDAAHCWRTQADEWEEKSQGVLLASGAGALGVRLGGPIHDSLQGFDRPELGLGEDASADVMKSTVGLVWRTLLMALALLTVIEIAGWLG